MAARHKEGYDCKESTHTFLVRKDLSIDDVSGCRRTPYFRRYARELVLKPVISFKKSWGSYRRTTPECYSYYIIIIFYFIIHPSADGEKILYY